MASLLEMLIASLCFNVAALYCIYRLALRLWARQTADTDWEVVEPTPMVSPTPVVNPTPTVNPTPVGNPTPMVNPTPVNQTPPPPHTGTVTIFENKRGRAAEGRAGRSVSFQLDTEL